MIGGLNVAVTGASGFLATHLLSALADEGHNVIAVGRHPPRVSAAFRRSSYDRESLARAFSGSHFVVHLAARTAMREDEPYDLDPFLGPNVVSLLALAEAAHEAGVQRIVFASSRAVYPTSPPKPLVENRDEGPQSAYGLSKLYAESYLAMLSEAFGFSTVSLRFAMLFGEGERETPAIMRFARMAGRQERLVLTGNTERRIDALYVKDAVEAVIAAIQTQSARGPINIGSGQTVSVHELASAVNEVFENRSNVTEECAVKGPPFGAPLAIRRAERLLGWSPRFTLLSGLQHFRTERQENRL